MGEHERLDQNEQVEVRCLHTWRRIASGHWWAVQPCAEEDAYPAETMRRLEAQSGRQMKWSTRQRPARPVAAVTVVASVEAVAGSAVARLHLAPAAARVMVADLREQPPGQMRPEQMYDHARGQVVPTAQEKQERVIVVGVLGHSQRPGGLTCRWVVLLGRWLICEVCGMKVDDHGHVWTPDAAAPGPVVLMTRDRLRWVVAGVWLPVRVAQGVEVVKQRATMSIL